MGSNYTDFTEVANSFFSKVVCTSAYVILHVAVKLSLCLSINLPLLPSFSCPPSLALRIFISLSPLPCSCSWWKECNTTVCTSCKIGSSCYLCPVTQYLQGDSCVQSCSSGFRRLSSAVTDRVCLAGEDY